MVRADPAAPIMGQACSATAPLTESFPSLNSIPLQSSNGNATELQATLSMLLSNSSELSSEELAKNLRSVLNENFDLKETVMQNNLALKHQLSLLEQWNLQVEQQKAQSSRMITESNKQIAALQKENHLLRSTLAASKGNSDGSKFQELDSTIKTLNDRIEANERDIQKGKEEKETLISQKSKIEGDNTLLKCSLNATRAEYEKLQLQRMEFISTIKDLRQVLENETKQNPRTPIFSVAPDPKLGKELENEQDTTATLLQELHDGRNQIDVLEIELRKARNESAKYKAMYAEASVYQDTASLVTALSNVSKIPDDPEKKKLKNEAALLRDEVEVLEKALSDERRRASDDRLAAGRFQPELVRLRRELQETKEKADRNEYTDQYYQAKIKSINEQHDEATAKLVSYEELLGAKNDDIARLKKDLGRTKARLTECHSEQETIAVLRAQVEVYQADFRAEREAREALATEREKLRDELRHLHARNTQMIDELESYQRRLFPRGQGRSSRASSEEPRADTSFLNPDFSWEKLSAISDKKDEDTSRRDEQPDLDENLLYCPKCNKTFNELRPLEEHVNRCLDED